MDLSNNHVCVHNQQANKQTLEKSKSIDVRKCRTKEKKRYFYFLDINIIYEDLFDTFFINNIKYIVALSGVDVKLAFLSL